MKLFLAISIAWTWTFLSNKWRKYLTNIGQYETSVERNVLTSSMVNEKIFDSRNMIFRMKCRNTVRELKNIIRANWPSICDYINWLIKVLLLWTNSITQLEVVWPSSIEAMWIECVRVCESMKRWMLSHSRIKGSGKERDIG